MSGRRVRSARCGSVLLLAVLVHSLSATLSAGAAELHDLGETVFINGFVSQGYLNTDDVDYLVPNSRAGTAEFLEAAVTVTAVPTDRLRLGIQLLARDFGDTGNGQVVLDWGYGDYRWFDALGFRAGKVKLPLGFYNEVRDLDFLRTTVFLPQSVYNEKLRDFLLAYQGVGVYGSHDLRGGGAVDYHVFGGSLNVPDPSRGYWAEEHEALALTAAPFIAARFDRDNDLPAGSSSATLAAISDPQVEFPYVWGGSLAWKTPWKPLRLGGTLLAGRFEDTAVFRYDVYTSDPDQPDSPARYQPYSIQYDRTSDIDHLTTLSAEITWQDLLLAGEYTETEIGRTMNNGWYAAADYRVSRLLAVAACYAAYYDDREHSGKAWEDIGLPAYYGHQKDLTIAARVDITDFWLLKAELHFMDGVALSQQRSLFEEYADTKPRNWTMFAAKTTFHF